MRPPRPATVAPMPRIDRCAMLTERCGYEPRPGGESRRIVLYVCQTIEGGYPHGHCPYPAKLCMVRLQAERDR